jgi:RNA polymerase subunit RPABC4/transcription elongation factor Spt4
VSVDHQLEPGKARFCKTCHQLLADGSQSCPTCEP